jgi:hypothetical protein
MLGLLLMDKKTLKVLSAIYNDQIRDIQYWEWYRMLLFSINHVWGMTLFSCGYCVIPRTTPILSRDNHYLDPIASKQCLADKEEHNIGNHPCGGGLHPLTTKGRKCRVILYKRAQWSTRRLWLVQGLRDLHSHYITKTDDCDWLEILLLWTAHTPCGVNSLRKSNQIKSNVLDNCRQEVNRIDIGRTDLILQTPSYVSGGGGRCIIDGLIVDYQTRLKRPSELACIKVQY